MKLFDYYIKKIFLLFFGCVLFYLALLSINSTSYIGYFQIEEGGQKTPVYEHTFYLSDQWWMHIGVFILFVVVLYCVYRKYAKVISGFLKSYSRLITMLLSLGVFLAGLLWIFNTSLLPRSDQAQLLEVAAQMADKDFSSFETGNYMFNFPYQRSMVLIYYAGTLLFRENAYLAAQVMNLVCLLIIYLTILKTLQVLGDTMNFGAKGAVVYFCMLLYFPFFFYITFIYGNIPGFAMVLLSVYFTVKYTMDARAKSLAAACIFMGIGLEFKNIYCIFLIAVELLLIYHAVSKKERLKTVIFILLLPLSYLAAGIISELIMESITQIPVAAGCPFITTVAMGLQEGSLASGWWNGYNRDVFIDNGCDRGAATAASIQSINKSFAGFRDNIGFAINFFAKKIASMWNNPTLEGFNVMSQRNSDAVVAPFIWKIVNGNQNPFVIGYLNFFQSLTYMGSLLYVVIRGKAIKIKELIFPVAFVGAFFFFLIWEAKCQYAIPYFVLLIPYSIEGYLCLLRIINVKVNGIGGNKAIVLFNKKNIKYLIILAGACLVMTMFTKTILFAKTIGLGDDNTVYPYFWEEENLRLDSKIKQGMNVDE